jgi:hypothetical protein
MISEELLTILRQVISSWEVLVVTVVLILYFFLVFYVARLYHRPRSFTMLDRKKGKKRFIKKKKVKTEVSSPQEPEIED